MEHLLKRLEECREEGLTGEPVAFGEARDTGVRQRYMDKVSAAKTYIQAGDAFQIVISQPFAAPAGATAPLYRYRQLKQSNPSPYMFYFFAGRLFAEHFPCIKFHNVIHTEFHLYLRAWFFAPPA